MRIAVGQYPSIAGDVVANVATAVEAVTAASAAAARVLVLPELFLTGYAMPPTVIDVDDPRLRPLDEAATVAGLTVIVGAATPGEGLPQLSLLTVGAGVRRVYDELHLCGEERSHFVAGEQPVAVEIDGWSLGLAICYDGCFPEHARVLADAGADVYVAAVAYFAGSEHRRDLYYRSRALDNGFFVAVSGLVGECGGAQFNGGSAVYDPEGRPLAAVAPEQVGVVVVGSTASRLPRPERLTRCSPNDVTLDM
ncbi:carbon-nitrogen hydrolase family protein [Aeromicrobium sp. UC242_57]|uniref:carbon-nitrogen hydrolase family protein n=1 Tax=Aeromicrobium sp. UC242_57 TaxID=3374624 RepID=UPI0037B21A0B